MTTTREDRELNREFEEGKDEAGTHSEEAAGLAKGTSHVGPQGKTRIRWLLLSAN